jgi:hypothetical protein
MATPEDQELMAKISSLAGKINRHKAQQDGTTTRKPNSHDQQPSPAVAAFHNGDDDIHCTDPNPASRASHHRASPYPSTGYRGAPRKPAYRNKTLVLNGQSQASPSADTKDTPNSATTSWVTKTDRHMQLINSAVYEKEAQSRSEAIGHTQRQKQLDKENHEKAKFAHHVRQLGDGAANIAQPLSKFEMEVDGIRFRVVKAGNKLVKVQGMA